MSFHQVAKTSDFAALPAEMQRSHIELLELCDRNRLSCRCEQAGRDFVVTIGRGFSSAKHWLDQFRPVVERR